MEELKQNKLMQKLPLDSFRAFALVCKTFMYIDSFPIPL